MIDAKTRFWAKVAEPDENGCRKWTGAASRGYGMFKLNGKSRSVHRLVYEWEIGPIPDGFTIDHVYERGCRSKLCVEVSHLEAVTQRENILRSKSPSAVNARKTHCKEDHKFTPDNTYKYPNGDRECRKCHNNRELRRYRRRKDKNI